MSEMLDFGSITPHVLLLLLSVSGRNNVGAKSTMKFEEMLLSSRTPSPKWTTVSTLPPITIPDPEYSQTCESIAYKFVYGENLCGAPDPDSYMEMAKAHYTCADRCGVVPAYRTEVHHCACDQACFVFKDCCRDFASVCSDIYAEDHVTFSYFTNFEDKFRPTCLHERFMGFKVAPLFYTQMPRLSTTTSPLEPHTVLKVEYKGSNQGRRSIISRLLDTVFLDFAFGDIVKGLFFENIKALNVIGEPVGNPFFLPQVAYLSCVDVSFDTPNSAAETLRSCFLNNVDDYITSFHRNCKIDQIVACNCMDGLILRQHVHNVCMGQNKTAPALTQHKLWSNHLEVQPLVTSQCSYFYTTAEEYSWKNPTFRLTRDRGTKLMSMSMVAYLTSFSYNNHSTSGKYTEDTSTDYEENAKPRPFRNIYYIVTLENTLERRLRCSRLILFLTDCVLVECMHGAVMSRTSATPGQFGGRSCIAADSATVLVPDGQESVPMCLCLRVLTAVSSLRIWSVRLTPGRKYFCSFQLSVLRPVAEADAESVMQYDTLSLLEPHRPTLEEKLQHIFQQTGDACPDTMEMDASVQICFYPAETAYDVAPQSAGRSACIPLSGAQNDQVDGDKHTGSSSGLSLVRIFVEFPNSMKCHVIITTSIVWAGLACLCRWLLFGHVF